MPIMQRHVKAENIVGNKRLLPHFVKHVNNVLAIRPVGLLWRRPDLV